MKLVVFGFGGSLGSPWGKRCTCAWPGLGRALARRGHRLVFFERAREHPAEPLPAALARETGIDLRLYADWDATRAVAAAELDDADVGLVTSCSLDVRAAGELVLSSRATLRGFYDLDPPATLADPTSTVGEPGLAGYDVVLARMGGRALRALERDLGARHTAALYPSVDPEVDPSVRARSGAASHALSYLEAYAADRRPALESLLIEPARRHPEKTFLLGGAGYPSTFAPPANIHLAGPVAGPDRPHFYGAAPLTLHVSRPAERALGHCPSARLFEATACGVAVLSEPWEGLGRFFTQGREILVARNADEAAGALLRPPAELLAMGRRARERTLDEHTAAHRAEELERLLGACARRAWPETASLSEEAR